MKPNSRGNEMFPRAEGLDSRGNKMFPRAEGLDSRGNEMFPRAEGLEKTFKCFFVNESGFYSLIPTSKQPKAIEFKIGLQVKFYHQSGKRIL